jgi:hypothetical protein
VTGGETGDPGPESACCRTLRESTSLPSRVRYGVMAALTSNRFGGFGEDVDVFSPFEEDVTTPGTYPTHVVLETCTGSLARIGTALASLRLVRRGGPGVKVPGLLSRRGEAIRWTPAGWWARRGCPDFEVNADEVAVVDVGHPSARSRTVCLELADGGRVGLVCDASLPKEFFAVSAP